MMSSEIFQQFLAIVLEHLSPADRERLADELRKSSHADMLRDRSRRLREYRVRWYRSLSDRAAAVAIEKDLSRLEASGYLHRVSPALVDPKRAAAFELLTAGPVLSADRIRKLLAGATSSCRCPSKSARSESNEP